jgi:hypothetical protein
MEDGYWGDVEIFFASRSADGVWTNPVNLSDLGGECRSPSIAVDAYGGVHVAWRHVNPPGFWRVYTTSWIEGEGWSEPQLVPSFSGNARDPLLLAGLDVDLVWSGGVEGNWEICHSRRDEDGTWSPAVNVSMSAGHSFYPAAVRERAGTLHVVWQDNTPDHYDIHYAASGYGLWLPIVMMRSAGAIP